MGCAIVIVIFVGVSADEPFWETEGDHRDHPESDRDGGLSSPTAAETKV
jgi:hypothetical protein